MPIRAETGPAKLAQLIRRPAAATQPVTDWSAQCGLFRALARGPFNQRRVLGVNGGAVSLTATRLRLAELSPVAHGLVADVDAALGQQVFHVPQAQREANIHHHHQPDDLG